MKRDRSPLLEIKEISKVFSNKRGIFKREEIHALREVSLSIYEGEVLGLVGESGSGKSTLGKLILRLEDPTKGIIMFKGENIYKIGKEYSKHVSVVFQDPRSSLNPRMKIKEIIEEPLKIHKIRNRNEKIKEALKLVALPEEFLEKKPEQLSGGQRQRVAIARAIVLEPKLIVADEPTSSLDVATQMEIISLIKLLKEKGIAFLFITHDLRIIKKISDRIAVLYNGMLMELGNTMEIFEEPMHPYTKYLLASLPAEHPSKRGEVEIEEIEAVYSGRGCPFLPKCLLKIEECSQTLRRKYINGRFIACNLY